MSVKRIIGTESEFGVLSAEEKNSIALSVWLVDSYAQTQPSGPITWDYRGEDPLNDARGFRLDRADAHPTQLTDNPEEMAPAMESVARPSQAFLDLPGPSNTVLSNGARFYVDHAHPEYSGPETAGPLEAVAYDLAGDEIARRAMAAAAAEHGPITLYKNNTDGKGASYGSHENYLVERSVVFDDLAPVLIPFLVTRQILCGAGRVGLGQRSQAPGFQVSQRADFIENDIGLETTFNRPILNTRDEPHALSRWRRLHVIVGDANLFEVSNFLKMGTTSAMLWYLENIGPTLELDALQLEDPVFDVAAVSHDPLGHRIKLRDGRSLTAIELQSIYAGVCRSAMERAGSIDDETELLLSTWESVLTDMSADLSLVADRVEWVAKYQILSGIRQRDQLEWDAPKLRTIDLQWHDLRPDMSVVGKLVRAGRVARLLTDSDIARCAGVPPRDTRAYLRGELIRRYPEAISAASWDSITVDTGEEALLRIPLLSPDRARHQEVGTLLEENDLPGFVSALKGQ